MLEASSGRHREFSLSIIHAVLFLVVLCSQPDLPCGHGSDHWDHEKCHENGTTDKKLDLWLNDGFLPTPQSDWITPKLSLVRKGRPLGRKRSIRHEVLSDCLFGDCGYGDSLPLLLSGYDDLPDRWVKNVRGGAHATMPYNELLDIKLKALGKDYGPDFEAAIQLNVLEHVEDCQRSCELFYCATENSTFTSHEMSSNNTASANSFLSYSMGAVPPEDFAEQFGFPLDLIKVSQGTPFFSPAEAQAVLEMARDEGVDGNEYLSGKYKLGGNWLDQLPQTRSWFNRQLESTFFPQMAQLFPEIVSSPSVLRAHSVSLLKYNSSHPRTDVHVDNGILALTVAMSSRDEYEGGGTFFEHMGVDHVLQMDVGHATFRPGSVRHGGHRVTRGTRYVLGCFILLQDRVEHVRRLKNRGAALRRQGDLDNASRHFEWALAINPKCTTCLKDWAEVLQSQGNLSEAEAKLRRALELLENQDSDALFNLGVILSEQGRDEESVDAYRQSIALNAEDAELCYNLAIKLGAQGRTSDETDLYRRAIEADPHFGGAWLNWGTVLAESGDLDGAENKFTQALNCGDEVAAKATMNLSILYHLRGEALAQEGDLETARALAFRASKLADDSKQRIDALLTMDGAASAGSHDLDSYRSKYKPHRLKCFRLVGQIHAGMGNLPSSEDTFRKATEAFPTDRTAWMMLGRVLQVQGKTDEAAAVQRRIELLDV